MISDKLKKITVIAIIMIYVHGLEEIIIGFWKVDSLLMIWNGYLTSIPQAVYFASHVYWWLMLVPILLLVLGGKWALRGLALFGVIFLIEIHHLVGALISWSYYPGLITALFYPIVGFFYWKELIRTFRDSGTKKKSRKH